MSPDNGNVILTNIKVQMPEISGLTSLEAKTYFSKCFVFEYDFILFHSLLYNCPLHSKMANAITRLHLFASCC